MSIRLAKGHPFAHLIHRLDRDEDETAWTICGIHFAWGYVPRKSGDTSRCAECWADWY